MNGAHDLEHDNPNETPLMPRVNARAGNGAVPISLIRPSDWPGFASAAPARLARAVAAAQFSAKPGQCLCLWDGEGAVERVLFGLGESGVMGVRGLPARLPAGQYRFDAPPSDADPAQAALAWSLGTYRFERYKKNPGEAPPSLAALDGDHGSWTVVARACAMARDMVNTPANDMGPDAIEAIAKDLAGVHDADLSVTRGAALMEGYPAVHAVGRAATSERAPRMIELAWGRASDPAIAVIGKGVTFDTGGLDLKPSAGMRWMKKDMGGAAHALALARMIMESALPVRLHVLLPVVENAVAADAMRPGDILASRKGLTIEVGNTDAEGRLILADALTRAGELEPALTIDLATLTGAARVALGPDVVPFYTDDEALAEDLAAAARAVEDPLWRMPLWAGYEAALDSDVADLKNDPDPWSQAGSVTAALFLKRFAPAGPWAHFDIFAWNGRGRPGWPQGAEAQAIRAIFAMLQGRYA